MTTTGRGGEESATRKKVSRGAIRLHSLDHCAEPLDSAESQPAVSRRLRRGSLPYFDVSGDELDFWKEPSRSGEQVHVMVADSIEKKFLDSLAERNITFSLMIDDVEKKISKQKEASEKARQLSWLRDAPFNRIFFNLGRYHSFAEIINFMNALAVTYPDRVHVMPIGTSHEGRQIAMIKARCLFQVGRPSRQIKPGIWIDGGIHAREWVSPAVVLYMIDQLVVHYDTDPQMRSFVNNLDWYIVPLLNPDGYEYSRSSTHPEVRLWRKNRSPPVCMPTRAGKR
ncbi:unnamed protein product [Toxocara canis]|uniref:Peptidase_M14 domain-containing protein n=1 Tax=Toxocara canis TaxID=6265 RepID=A0A183UGQ2_TOXCA|nr:unnamed protein product [Toxocara canis]